MKNNIFLLSGLVFLFSCQEQKSAPAEKKDITIMDTAPAKKELIDFVNNKKDPICGMPVTAGVSDTLHYQGKVLGFCAPECKAEFAAKPADYPVEYK